jgi:putative CocE/NonD family hydrolase
MTAPARCEARALFNVRIPMRDGIHLAADVYLPPAEGKGYPVIVSFSPYDATSGRSAGGMSWVNRGFAYVGADCRGRFKSEGDFEPWVNEVRDARDLLDWIAAQPWCDGNIGMVGGSYVAATQLAAVAGGHPALKAAAPSAMQADHYDLYYTGGALVLGFQPGWHIGMTARGRAPATPPDWSRLVRQLPLNRLDELAGIPCPSWKAVTAHPVRDAFWRERSVGDTLARAKTDLFLQGSWYDPICPSILDEFALARPGQYTCLRIGPWVHGVNTLEGEIDYGPAARVTEEAEIDFLTARLAGREPATARQPAPLQIFVMGANVWRFEDEWPLKRTRWTSFYLGSGGHANTSGGDGWLGRDPVEARDCPADTFTYDPENPVPTCGGRVVGAGGQRNQSEVEKRNDVLVYTLPPLTADLEATGPVAVRLFVSSTAPDTDFTVKLVDVFPDGRPFNVCEGIQRMRYRGGAEGEAALLAPGVVYDTTVEADCTSYVFKRGHRIRLQVSSSNFPHYSRNPNTGRDPAAETELKTAVQTIHHSADFPSRLILPVIDSAFHS